MASTQHHTDVEKTAVSSNGKDASSNDASFIETLEHTVTGYLRQRPRQRDTETDPRRRGQQSQHPPTLTPLMTIGTGCLSLSTPYNLGATYAIVTIGSIGTGAVIIPSSLIAQIVCPPELIETITAITLAIRHIGGAIGFTAYYNIFYHKLTGYLTELVGYAVVVNGIADQTDVETIGTLMFEDLEAYIQASPTVMNKGIAYDVVIKATQEGFALGYRWPYWMSIAFGGVGFILAFRLKDIRKFL